MSIFKYILTKSKTHTLKFRTKFFLLVILLIVIGAPLAFLIHIMDKNHEEMSTNLIETTTHAVYQSIFDGLMTNDNSIIQQTLENYRYKPNIEALRIYRPDGTILFSAVTEEVGQNILTLSSSKSHIYPLNRNGQESFVKDGNLLTHQHPVYIQKECTACHKNEGELIAIMDVQVGLSDASTMYTSTKRLLILCAVLMTVLLWFSINFFFESQIENRIKKIMEGFQQLATGNLNTTLNIKGNDEIGILAQEFNRTVRELRQVKQNEAELMRENLARADRLITMGEITAEIAHEVNNPAGIILSRAELVRDELQIHGNGVTGCVDDINMIILQTERIAQTTHGILQYARKLPDQLNKIDLAEVISKTIEMMSPRIKKCNARITLRGIEQPAYVWGNFHQLEQVFCNLLSNSLDVIPSTEGSVDIHLQKIHSANNCSRYQIDFRDNGPGIPQELRDDVFSAFFTTKSPGKGTGLGLFIVRNILTRHNGRIFLDEQNSSGAHFIIELEAEDE